MIPLHHFVWPWAAAAALVAGLTGCSDSTTPRLAAFLDELDVETPIEQHAEIPVGKYSIPVTVERDDRRVQWRLFKFELYAVTSLENRAAVEAAWDRRHGEFQDQVIKICRSVSAEELEDQRLATLKARLVDMARPILGEHQVHQMFIVDAVMERI